MKEWSAINGFALGGGNSIESMTLTERTINLENTLTSRS